MTLAEDEERRSLLSDVMDWGTPFEGFEEHHAGDALAIARAFLPPRARPDRANLVLSAISSAFWFWLDDRSDTCLHQPNSPVDFAALLRIAQGKQTSPSGAGPEGTYLNSLSHALRESAQNSEEHRWWLVATARTLEGVWKEELANRATADFSYAEYVENGIKSGAVEPIVAATSLIYGLGRFSRGEDSLLRDLERHFCIHQRLLNDTKGVERDSREGRHINPVLALARQYPRMDAAKFVSEQAAAYERILREEAEMLGDEDPFAQLIISALSRIDRWYADKPSRYHGVGQNPGLNRDCV